MPQPQTLTAPPRPQPRTLTEEERHRKRVMGALSQFLGALERTAQMLDYRYRSSESSGTVREYLEMIADVRSPASARDRLGEILESPRGSIKPPQLDLVIRNVVRALFNAMDRGDGLRWPSDLLTAHQYMREMFDPYAAARVQLRRGSSGTIVIVLGEEVQSPAASHSNSVAVTPSPATSRRVSASRSGKAKHATGAAATMACAAI